MSVGISLKDTMSTKEPLLSDVVIATIVVTDLACVNVMLFLVVRHFFLQTKQFHACCNLISIILSKGKFTKGAVFST